MIRNKTGMWGEIFATRYLRDRGYEILSTNYVCRFGEIDIIAMKDGVMSFVEVKTRQSLKFWHPREAVNYYKQQKIRGGKAQNSSHG